MSLSQKPSQMQNRCLGTAKGVVVNIDRLLSSGHKMIGIRTRWFITCDAVLPLFAGPSAN